MYRYPNFGLTSHFCLEIFLTWKVMCYAYFYIRTGPFANAFFHFCSKLMVSEDRVNHSNLFFHAVYVFWHYLYSSVWPWKHTFRHQLHLVTIKLCYYCVRKRTIASRRADNGARSKPGSYDYTLMEKCFLETIAFKLIKLLVTFVFLWKFIPVSALYHSKPAKMHKGLILLASLEDLFPQHLAISSSVVQPAAVRLALCVWVLSLSSLLLKLYTLH